MEEWNEMRMFPIPQDDDFMAAVQRWIELHGVVGDYPSSGAVAGE